MPDETGALGRRASDMATRDLTTLLFMIFAFIADSDRDITPQEVRALLGLSSNPRWTPNAAMRRALAPLRTDYSRLWSSYEAKKLIVTRTAVAERLRAIYGILSENEFEELRRAVRLFIDKLEPAGISAVPGPGAADNGRVRARREMLDLLTAPTAMVPPEPASPVPAPAMSGFGGLSVWTRGRTRVRCVRVTPETQDVKTFCFMAQPACLFAYKPGQFVTLELPIDGRVVRRSYTISSSPSRPFLLSITVKRIPDGLASAWLHDNLREGVELDLHGPNGDFSCLDHPSDKLMLISGGSGVTPMMSMLRYLADTAPQADIAFLNSVRSPADIIFGQELHHLGRQFGEALRLGILPSAVARGQGWNGVVGRLDATRLTMLVPDFRERETFVCGPEGFMEAVQTMLRGLGYPMRRFHQESFGAAPKPRPRATAAAPATAPAAPPKPVPAPVTPPAPAAAPGTVSIVFARSGVTHAGSAEDCLLDIAEANGVAMDSSCRSGACGTCRVKVTSGTVRMDPQHLLGEDELAEGYVLACITRGQGRVTIDA